MNNKIPKIVTKMKTWLIVMTTVTATYAGLAAIGIDVPRPAWFSEHKALAVEVRDNRIKLYRGDVKSLQSQLRDARIARARVNRTKNPRLYEELLRGEDEIKDDLEEAKDALVRARRRK